MLCFLFCYVSLFIMFCSFLCYVQILCRVLFLIAFCSDTLYSFLFRSVSSCRVISCFLFNKIDCTYTLLYIIDKGGRKKFFVRMYRLCFVMKRCRLSRIQKYDINPV